MTLTTDCTKKQMGKTKPVTIDYPKIGKLVRYLISARIEIDVIIEGKRKPLILWSKGTKRGCYQGDLESEIYLASQEMEGIARQITIDNPFINSLDLLTSIKVTGTELREYRESKDNSL